MTTIKPEDLASPWSRYSALSKDLGPDGTPGDGVLTVNKLKVEMQALETQAIDIRETGGSDLFLTMRLNDTRELYNDLVKSGADGLQYLPDEVMALPDWLRRRASEVLLRDDQTLSGVIDQYAIDHARGRYNAMTPMNAAMLASQKKALSEINQIAAWLHLN